MDCGIIATDAYTYRLRRGGLGPRRDLYPGGSISRRRHEERRRVGMTPPWSSSTICTDPEGGPSPSLEGVGFTVLP